MKWTITIPDYVPSTVNQHMRGWRQAGKLKKADADLISAYAKLTDIPKATGPRTVTITITVAGRGRTPDPDAFLKSVLDGLKLCGMIRDDGQDWAGWSQPVILRGERRQTVITLEDVCD